MILNQLVLSIDIMKKICYFFSENIRFENHFLIIFVNRNNFFSSFVFF